MKFFKNSIYLTYKLPLLFLLLASTLNFLPVWHWMQDVNRSFIPVYLYLQLTAVLLIFCFGLKRVPRTFNIIIAVAFIFMSFSYGLKVLPHYPFFASTSDTTEAEEGQVLSLAFSVIDNRSKLEQALTGIRVETPDIAALVISKEIYTEDILPDFPHRVKIEDQRVKLLLLSNFQIESEPVFSLGSDLYDIIFAEVQTESSTIKIGLFEIPAVRSANDLRTNKIILRRFAMQLRHSDADMIILSDLKVSPFSSLYGSFAYASDLSNAGRGFGFPGTGNCIYPLTSCSHVLFKGEMQTRSVRSTGNVMYSEFILPR